MTSVPTQDDILEQQKLLQTHRLTLSHYLQQRARLGRAYMPPAVVHGTVETRNEIRRIKRVLRGWNVEVEDHPDDDEEKPFREQERFDNVIETRDNEIPQIAPTYSDSDKLEFPLSNTDTRLRSKYSVSNDELLSDLLRKSQDQPPSLSRPALLLTDSQPANPVRNSLTVIVPIYNESRIVGDLVKGLKSEGLIGKYTVILCDDGSTDNSFEVMQKYSKGIKNIKCVRNGFNTRKVGAIDKMARMVQTPFVLTLDADCILSELKEDALEELMERMHLTTVICIVLPNCFKRPSTAPTN